MSIINDALKKTQTVYEAQQKGHKGHPDQEKQETKTKDFLILVATTIIGIGFIGCLIILLTLLWPKSSLSPNPSTPPLVPSNVPSSLPLPTAKSGLTLNGIIKSEGHQTALINNKIVKEGNEIEGKKVLRILDNQVKIYDNGKIILLEIEK